MSIFGCRGALVPVAIFGFLTGCLTEDEADEALLGEEEQEVVVGSFAARFDDTLRGGGVVAQGASLSGRLDMLINTSADITIAGIPAGATVQRALLYWMVSGGTDNTATINGFAVTGALLATAGETCFGAGVNNTVYRADVTARVSGNGVFTIAGLPSSVTATAADTDGAALVVSYQSATSGTRRRVMIRDGAISSSGSNETVNDTFTGVAAPIASAGRFHVVVGDGQSATDGNLVFNGTTVGANQFPGSDGSLMDVNSYNVTVPAGLANAAWSSTTGSDCLLYGSAVVEWNVAVCGDGLRTGGEACENGNTANGDGCSSTCDVEPGWTCTAGPPSVCTPICGDGIRNGAETCDQGGGNTTNGDGCSATCQVETGWSCAGTPSTCAPVCGDGIRAGAETCDQGGGNTTNGDGCSATCQVETGWSCAGTPSVCTTTCGDGIRAGAEACDDGDTMTGDGCSAVCAIEPGWTCVGAVPSVCTTTCGDGIRAGAEACDDGDTMAGDGCDAVCAVESGWTCAGDTPSVCTTTCGDGIVAGAEACDDGDTMPGDGCDAVCVVENGWTCVGTVPSVCTTTCGDGVRAGAEACDDGDVAAGDGCDAVCAVEPGWTCSGLTPDVCVTTCGDGVIAGAEACDDGAATSGDGCSATCAVEPGWTCSGQPSGCDEICGDGLVVGDEACDDGGTATGDGCGATCAVEPGWSCTGEPSVCTTGCGDGITAGAEACDDGNTVAGDGCTATCTVEPGWTCTDLDPSTCTTTCGDGLIAGAELCDDGDAEDGDGCSASCTLEANWVCGDNEPTTCERISVAGGGCAAGGGGGPLGLGLLLVGGVLALARRRRRIPAAVALVIVAAAGPAAAQEVDPGSTGYPAERFQLSMDRGGILDVESARTPGHLVIDLGLWLGYANDPLTLRLGDDRDRLASLVSDRYGGDLVASVGIGERLELGLAAPLIVSQDQDLGALMSTESLSSFGFGDLRLTPKLALLRGGFDLALAVAITAPTSGADNYLGDDGLTGAPQLLAGKVSGKLRLGLGLGWRIREAKRSLDLDIDDELFVNAGAGVRAGDKLEVMASFAFATAAADPLGAYNRNHAEVHGGLGFDVSSALRLFAAGGVGLSEGYGTADWRALAGVWLGAGKARGGTTEPPPPVREPEPVVDLDADHDGIPTPTDTCPDAAETKNRFQDDDGCPDAVPDGDGDGQNDLTDACPGTAEDLDGFEDDDGCPDEDNDRDGVVDESDRCVDEAGVVENGGCPDTDRDGDTVVDRLDNCPDEPGTVTFFGCKEKQLVIVTGATIELLDIVYFKTNKAIIDRRSFKLLTNVATVVKARPELTKVTVEGHTDDQGDDAYNKDLSQRRAQAVADFLIGKGVEPTKLEPIGYGEEKPLGENTTRKGRAKNRRVEFKLQ